MNPTTVIIFSSLYGAGIAGNIIGSTIYDFKELRKERDAARHPNTKQYRNKPLTSVIVVANNAEASIENCLENILKSSYRKYEVIIIDNASKDSTAKIVQEFMRTHKKAKISVLKKRRKVGYNRAMADGYKKSKGELITAIISSDSLEPASLRNATRHFNSDDIDILEPNVHISSEPSIVSALDQFMSLMDARSKKIAPLVNSQYGSNGTGVIYKREAFRTQFSQMRRKKKTDTPTIKYARDVSVTATPVNSYRDLIKRRRTLKAATLDNYLKPGIAENKIIRALKLALFVWKELIVMVSPLALTVFAYLAFRYDQRVLLGIVWGVLVATMAYIVWTSEGTNVRDKLRLSLFLPVMYVLFYLIAAIEIVTNFAYLGSFKKPKKRSSKKKLVSAAKVA